MTIWLTARGAGLAALVLLTMSTCLGALVSQRASADPRDPRGADRRYIAQYAHRALGASGLLVLLLHIVMILADSYAHVGWRGALVPFRSAYRPVWIGVGTIAVYTFILVSALGMARGRMASSPRGARWWRAVHCLAYAGWAAAMLHGFNSGTDSSAGWVRALYLGCLVAVLGCAAARLARLRPTGRDRFAAQATARPSDPTRTRQRPPASAGAAR